MNCAPRQRVCSANFALTVPTLDESLVTRVPAVTVRRCRRPLAAQLLGLRTTMPRSSSCTLTPASVHRMTDVNLLR
jgi:hypothetical protein